MTKFNSTTTSPASLVSPMRRTPQRITITMPWTTYQRLLARSDDEGRSLSNLAAHLLERGLS